MVLHKSRPAATARAAVLAGRAGAAIVGSRVMAPKVSGEVSRAGKLDRDELPRMRRLSPGTRRAMVTARESAGLGQSDLNTRAALPLNMVRDIEAGRACPTPDQMTRLSRTLRVSLRYARD